MQVKKAIEISDAKIQFVSLVDKAANLRQFLITKAEDGTAQFSTYGRILKVDTETHYLTGIVYEPLIEDAHGNYMTEAEIQKAAYWFAKNGDQVDIQHSFAAATGVDVVENYIAPCDMVIGDTPVVKGTWLITVEVSDAEVWAAVEKGVITGFSMGGLGKYSEEDVDLSEINKTAAAAEQTDVAEKKGLLKKFAEFLGLSVVEKGAMLEAYEERAKYDNFWSAFYTLENLLYHYNWHLDSYEFETDETKIRESLEEFSAILTDILANPNIAKGIAASLPLLKAGKKMSGANQKKLDEAYQALADLREDLIDAEDDDSGDETIEKEEIDMNDKEVQKMIDAAIAKALEAKTEPGSAGDTQGALTEESVQKMIDAAIAKALEAPADGADTEPLTEESVQKMIDEHVAKAVAPILQARSLPSNLNDAKQVEKADDVFAGLFV